jgi:tetratricopeptide (TPR) repeat protein
MDSLRDAHILRQEAIKKKNKFLFLGIGEQSRNEKVGDLFKMAGEKYKENDQWELAGQCFVDASEAYSKLGYSSRETTEALIQSAECFRKIDIQKCINTYKLVIRIYDEAGCVQYSAKFLIIIAEIHKENKNMKEACDAYRKAHVIYLTFNNMVQACHCLQMVASILSSTTDTKNISECAEIYESVAKWSYESKYHMGRYNTKFHLFDCLFCYLALGDFTVVRQKLELFATRFSKFKESTESDFIFRLLLICESADIVDFNTFRNEFNQYTVRGVDYDNLFNMCKNRIENLPK